MICSDSIGSVRPLPLPKSIPKTNVHKEGGRLGKQPCGYTAIYNNKVKRLRSKQQGQEDSIITTRSRGFDHNNKVKRGTVRHVGSLHPGDSARTFHKKYHTVCVTCGAPCSSPEATTNSRLSRRSKLIPSFPWQMVHMISDTSRC
ncbi:unnamed protein product [Ectocarpus fasciculatus]